MKELEPPEGIIVTVSAKMYGENGYRHWLRNFLSAMEQSAKGMKYEWYYWLRQGSQPKRQDILYVYLCIGGKIRFRTIFAGSQGTGYKVFDDGREMWGRAWIILARPVVRAPFTIPMKGFQGFRYTHKLF